MDFSLSLSELSVYIFDELSKSIFSPILLNNKTLKKYSLILTFFPFPFIKFYIPFRRYNIVHFEINFVTFHQKCFRYDDSKDTFYRLMVIRILLPCDSISLATS